MELSVVQYKPSYLAYSDQCIALEYAAHGGLTLYMRMLVHWQETHVVKKYYNSLI
jgi:hypothetical protein